MCFEPKRGIVEWRRDLFFIGDLRWRLSSRVFVCSFVCVWNIQLIVGLEASASAGDAAGGAAEAGQEMEEEEEGGGGEGGRECQEPAVYAAIRTVKEVKRCMRCFILAAQPVFFFLG